MKTFTTTGGVPAFFTVQTPAGKAMGQSTSRDDIEPAFFFELASRKIVSYVLNGESHAAVTGSLRRVRGGLSAAHLHLAKTMLSVRDHDHVTLVVLGCACRLSPSHFAREFKQSTGLPPHRWAVKNKVSMAKDMLMHSGLALSEIAFACGFVDQSHLGRWFRRLTGISPKAWQRLYLDADASADVAD